MEVYDILLADIRAYKDASELFLKHGNVPQYTLVNTTYNKLADLYLALTGIEVRPGVGH